MRLLNTYIAAYCLSCRNSIDCVPCNPNIIEFCVRFQGETGTMLLRIIFIIGVPKEMLVLLVYNNMLRLQKSDIYDRIAAVIVLFAASLRILLVALGWPPTNSDEGVMAIMAMNIAYRRATPLMFYGQDYMGTIEAYLGAGFFHLFGGPSLFALRLGVVLFVTLFLICMYLLTRLLFAKPLAIVTLLMLSVGSIPMLTRQMIATGGSSQTLFFGSLAFLLAVWLSSTYKQHRSSGIKVRRLVGYAIWGLAVGLGIWSDMVVLPFLAMAGLLLVIFCWRELLLWTWLVVLPCIVIGMLPLIQYDLALKLSSWTVLANLMHGGKTSAPQTLLGIFHNITSTILVSIPTATGNPFCPVNEIRVLGDNSPHAVQCTILHASWGGGYLLLLMCALGLTCHTLWHLQFRGKLLRAGPGLIGTISTGIRTLRTPVLSSGKELGDLEQHQVLVRSVARLLLLGAAALAICIYTLSSAPVDMPGFHARYLVSLLIATPALLFPLWNAAILHPLQTFAYIKVYVCRGILLLIWSLVLVGTIIAFNEVSIAKLANQQRQALITHLKHIGVTHFYTDYWTCYNLIFASDEQVVCAILKSDLQPWDNRVPRYFDIVKADTHAAYVFPLDTSMLPVNYHALPAVERKVVQAAPGKYRRYVFDGYVVYQSV